MRLAAYVLRSLLVLALAFLTPAAWAADEPGSSDHPLVGRFQGSDITYYKHSDFDEAALLKAPHDYATLLNANRLSDRSGGEWLTVEGAVTAIRYEIPPNHSSLEVLRNYEKALNSAGFHKEFSCADQACFAGTVNDPYLMGLQLDTTNSVSTTYFDHARYLLSSRSGPEGTVYAAILTGEDKDRTTAFVHVVETKPMDSGQITVAKADDMASQIKSAGKVDLYGILFDSGQASIKSESEQALDEVGKLLTSSPELRLTVVGHTDNVGGDAYNMDLSRRRAASVVAALTLRYQIAADRLAASGAGMTMPVASNDSEEGRAKNRRVELRAQ